MATGTEDDGSMDELPPQQGQGATARQQSEIRTEQITATGNHTNQKILSPSQYFANLQQGKIYTLTAAIFSIKQKKSMSIILKLQFDNRK